MNGFSRLAYVETKLFLRETGAAIGVFGLPVALVIGFGLIPGFGDPQKGLSGQIGTEYIASVSVAIVLAVLGLTGVPMVIGQYRERGILRRLGVTPVRPQSIRSQFSSSRCRNVWKRASSGGCPPGRTGSSSGRTRWESRVL